MCTSTRLKLHGQQQQQQQRKEEERLGYLFDGEEEEDSMVHSARPELPLGWLVVGKAEKNLELSAGRAKKE